MMLKQTNKKGTVKFTRIYFISTNNDDLKTLNKIFETNKPAFIDKIFLSKTTSQEITNHFINIKLNTDLSEALFEKMAEKLNKILNNRYKIFYTDANNKFVYIHKDIIDDINKSFDLFIKDD